jgi:hypothetical protein
MAAPKRAAKVKKGMIFVGEFFLDEIFYTPFRSITHLVILVDHIETNFYSQTVGSSWFTTQRD